ncbi:MAG: DUF2332 domain-containing protein [Pseudomonadota bacterium]
MAPLPRRLAEAFSAQSRACAELRSNFSALLCALVARDGVPDGGVREKLAELTNANTNLGPSGASLPLRFLGALHHLVLDGHTPQLAAAYPPNLHPGEGELAARLNAALAEHSDLVCGFLSNAPQTNETGRSAVIAPAFALLAAKYGLPLKLSELGASAGLNLNWPHYDLDYGQWATGSAASSLKIGCRWVGPALDPVEISVIDSVGCDLNPMLLETQTQRNALLAYVWPDQAERMSRLQAALQIAAQHRPKLVAQDAASFVAARLAEGATGQCHVVYHTVAWQYFPLEQQITAREALDEAGARATASSPLAWLRFESDNGEGGKGAKLSMTVWDGTAPEGQLVELGRADFHGRWVHWMAGKQLEI